MRVAFWTLEEEARLVPRPARWIDHRRPRRGPPAHSHRDPGPSGPHDPEETSHLKREQRVEWLREQLLTDRDYDWATALATTRRRQHTEVLALAPHTGTIWTPAEDEQVRAAIHACTPTSELAAQLKRSRKSTARRLHDLREDPAQRHAGQQDTGTPPTGMASTVSLAEPASRTSRSTSNSTTAASAPTIAAVPPAEGVPAAAAAVGSAHGKLWAEEETFALFKELRQGMTVDDVAAAHGRTACAINGRAAGILTQLTGRKYALTNAAEQLQARLTPSSSTTTTASPATPKTATPKTATTSSPPAGAPTDLKAVALAHAVLGATALPGALSEGEQ